MIPFGPVFLGVGTLLEVGCFENCEEDRNPVLGWATSLFQPKRKVANGYLWWELGLALLKITTLTKIRNGNEKAEFGGETADFSLQSQDLCGQAECSSESTAGCKVEFMKLVGDSYGCTVQTWLLKYVQPSQHH